MTTACTIKFAAKNSKNILTKCFGEDIAAELISLNKNIGDFSKTANISGKEISSKLYEKMLEANYGDEVAAMLAKASILMDYKNNSRNYSTLFGEPQLTYNNIRTSLSNLLGIPVKFESPEYFQEYFGTNAKGFVLNGTIYLNDKEFSLDTPLHEYTHLWALSMQYFDPSGWGQIVDSISKLPEFLNIQDNSLDLNEQVAEFLADYTGKKYGKTLSNLSNSALDILQQAMSKLWLFVSNLFKFESAEQIADKVFYDFISRKDLGLLRIYLSLEKFNKYLNSPYQIYYKDFEGRRLGSQSNLNGQPIIFLDKNITPEKVFNYIYQETASLTSQQKRKVFRQLAELGYTEDYLRTLIQTNEDAEDFIKFHEISHAIHKDALVYKQNGDSLMTDDKIAIEKRATIDAIKVLLYKKYLKDHKYYQLEEEPVGITFTTSEGSYKLRTEENTKWSDVTLAIAADFTTAGEKLTRNSAGKKYIAIDISKNPEEAFLKLLKNWQELKLKLKNIKLNIAGNGIYTFKKFNLTQSQVDSYVKNLILFLLDNGITIKEIRSGGQTGADESGVKAAVDLGIKASVHAPKNYKFRTIENKDIESESAFKSRFIKPKIETVIDTATGDPAETSQVQILDYNTLSDEDKYIYDFIQALELDDESKNRYIYGFVNGDSYVLSQIRKFMEQYSIRLAELLVDGKYFATPYLNNISGHYDWKSHLGGLNIFKPVKDQSGYLYTIARNYQVSPAEIIIPKLYASKFHFGNKSLFEITPEFFKNANTFYDSPLLKAGIKSDFLVRTHSGRFSIVVTNSFSEFTFGEIYQPIIQDGYVLDTNGDRMFKINDLNNVEFRMINHHLTVLVKNNDLLENTIETILDKSTLTDVVSIQPFLDNIELYGREKALNFIELATDNSEFKFLNSLLLLAANLQDISKALHDVYDKNRKAYKNIYSQTQYESFVKTLKILATRIPTQALQSFMEMQTAAFTGDYVNAAFVSRWQLWLQGSKIL